MSKQPPAAIFVEASVEVLVRQNGFRLGLTQAAAAHLTSKPAPSANEI